MRHNLGYRKLGRVTEHRLALLRNQAIFEVCGMSVMNAQSSRDTSLLPSSDRSVPIYCAFSNPLMSWQLKQP